MSHPFSTVNVALLATWMADANSDLLSQNYLHAHRLRVGAKIARWGRRCKFPFDAEFRVCHRGLRYGEGGQQSRANTANGVALF